MDGFDDSLDLMVDPVLQEAKSGFTCSSPGQRQRGGGLSGVDRIEIWE